jgi:hypothetical protein
MVCAPHFGPCGSTLGLDALPEGVHEIYNIGAGRLFRPFDFLTFRLFRDQLFQRVLILVLKLPGLKIAAFCTDDCPPSGPTGQNELIA